jgi:hypothetical protein
MAPELKSAEMYQHRACPITVSGIESKQFRLSAGHIVFLAERKMKDVNENKG